MAAIQTNNTNSDAACPKHAFPVSDDGTVLVLRTCDDKMQGHGGFQWPESGGVEAPDWNPEPECGRGLHGLLWAQGSFGLLNHDDTAWWVVVRVRAEDIAVKPEKVKFRAGEVVYRTRRWWEAVSYVRQRRPITEKTAHNTARYGHASATGYSGHASATGYSGHASATGYSGHASATGHSGHASATGYSGHASATGDSGHAIATGYYGHASATGHYAVAATLGTGGRVKAGATGALVASWWDESTNRVRVAVAYPGEDGIEPGEWYVVKGGNFVKGGGAS